MLRHHFITAIRALSKFKAYATINLLGLALGLTTGIFILMFVLDEISFDRFHTKANRIYRVGTDMTDIKTGAVNGRVETNGWPVGMLLKKDYPEIESVVYLRSGSDLTVSHEGKRFEQRLFFTSEDFFNIFTFPLKEGSPATALAQPNTVVISESMEQKFFPGSSALGKTLVFVDTLSFLVTGVMKDVPAQSHMQFDILVSFATFPTLNKEFSFDDGWGNLNVRNYVLLKEGTDAKNFVSKARNLYMNYVKDDMKKFGMFMYVGFEPLRDVYLKSPRGNGMGPTGSMERVYIVSGIAAFVILLACINFINLSTARSAYRAKEVGLRKVVGSSRLLLIGQFLSESFMLTILAFLLAMVFTGLLMPLFNQLVGKSYGLSGLLQPSVIAALVLLILAITLLSGYYPALALSALRPAEVLKGKMQTSSSGVQLRRVLVVFQFMISASLILCTLVARDQLDYMKNRDLGFHGDQIVVLNISKLPSSDLLKHESFKNDLMALSSVDRVTFTNAVPGKPGWVGQWAHAEEKSADETIGVEYMAIDEDYLGTLDLTLVAGHNFDISRPGELEDGLIINEKAVQQMGWETPEKALGKRIASPSNHPAGKVIGVVKDYHEFGLQRQIYP
ncbi:MAG TPA: ABC transporter permease, partial [Cyclobacteriaceae bacterium]|nr:ABC transporter permease [Cyclobacteriaceae bacterium]